MNKEFTPDCDHHLQMETSPDLHAWYKFGCRKCPGKILVPAKDTRGKTIDALFAGVLTTVRGGWS
jgi:hypothetical protein